MDYLLQQQTSMYMLEISISVYLCWKKGREARENPCALPNTDTDFRGYVRAKDFSAYVESRKEIILLNYLLQLQITVTRLVVALDSSPDISFFFC